MCGLPGAGKTYLAQLIKQMFEADVTCTLDEVLTVAKLHAAKLVDAERMASFLCQLQTFGLNTVKFLTCLGYTTEATNLGAAVTSAMAVLEVKHNSETLPLPEEDKKGAPDSVLIVSADELYIRSDGVFAYDASKARLAHGRAQAKLDAAFTNPKVRTVIIDNCNLKPSDLEGYVTQPHVSRAEWTFRVVSPSTPWANDPAECARLCEHNISKEAITLMQATFDPRMPLLTKKTLTARRR